MCELCQDSGFVVRVFIQVPPKHGGFGYGSVAPVKTREVPCQGCSPDLHRAYVDWARKRDLKEAGYG